MTDLTTFLLAQIAAEEERARYVLRYQVLADEGWSATRARRFGVDGLVDQRQELARCAALRAIVEAHPLSPYYGLDRYGRWLPREGEPKFWYCDCESDDGMIGRDGPCVTLRALASIYADADGYDPGWAL